MTNLRRLACPMLVVILIVALPGMSFGQQSGPVGAVPVKEPVAGPTARPIEKPPAQLRRKRGGLNSLPGDNTSATPAEGQSDLIKVLQPGQRTK